MKLRKEHPGVFCGIVSSCLAVLAILGHMISGSSFVVFGLIAAGLVSTKYNFQILKVENKGKCEFCISIDLQQVI